MKFYFCTTLPLGLGLTLLCSTTSLAQRDPWQWPFDKYSIWNMPIGSNARYADIDIVASKGAGTDVKHFLELNASDPQRQVIGFLGFAPDAGRCSGTEDMNGLTVSIPDDWLVPDAYSGSPYGRTPNSGFVFRLPNSDSTWNGPTIARCTVGGPLYMQVFQKWPNNRFGDNLYGDGYTKSTGQGASGMSGLGGTLRLGELVGNAPIRHVLKLNVWGRFLYYSAALPGYKWPAIRADNYANTPGAKNRYVGDDPNLVMGSLLAIPPNVTEASLGLTTEVGRKLFFTLQNYGAYITEDPGQDILDLIVERGVSDEVEARYGFSLKSDQWDEEFNKLAAVIEVVTNNTPTSIGGGGIPLQPLAPDFNDDADVFPNPNAWYYLENQACAVANKYKRLDTNDCVGIDLGIDNDRDKQWRFELSPDGQSYYVTSRVCKKYLDVDNCSSVDLNQTATSDNQHWYLIPAGNDFFYLQNKNCGQRLDSDQCNTIDVGSGTSLAKRWRLVKAGAANARTVREERKTTNTLGVQANSLQLYPNPSRGGFTVSTDQAVSVQIIDATGRTVYRSKHASKKHTIDLPDHPNGTYLLRTSTGQTAKFIKD